MTLGRSSCEFFSLQKGNNSIFHETLTNVLLKQLPSKKRKYQATYIIIIPIISYGCFWGKKLPHLYFIISF